MVQIRFLSTPPGANVTRAADGKLLGVTPFLGSFARGGEEDHLKVSVEKAGYRAQIHRISLMHDGELAVQLSQKNKIARDPDAERKL